VSGWRSVALAAASVGALLMVGPGCDVLHPPPTRPHPNRISINDPSLLVISDLALSCEERMEEMAYLSQCTMATGAEGREARCALEIPFAELMFGCGRDPEHPAERLRLTLAQGGKPAIFRTRVEELFGPCSPATAQGADGEPPAAAGEGTRCYLYEGQHGFAVASGPRSFAAGRTAYPMGIFMELPAGGALDAATPEQATDEASPPATLELETELLSGPERATVVQQIESILTLGPPATTER